MIGGVPRGGSVLAHVFFSFSQVTPFFSFAEEQANKNRAEKSLPFSSRKHGVLLSQNVATFLSDQKKEILRNSHGFRLWFLLPPAPRRAAVLVRTERGKHLFPLSYYSRVQDWKSRNRSPLLHSLPPKALFFPPRSLFRAFLPYRQFNQGLIAPFANVFQAGFNVFFLVFWLYLPRFSPPATQGRRVPPPGPK